MTISGWHPVRLRSLRLVACAVAVAIPIAACSSSGSTSSSTAAGGSTAGSTTSAGTSACVTAAQAAMAAVEKPITPVLPTAQVNMATMKGKNIWFVGVSSSIPLVNTIGQGVKAAGAAVGANVTVFDGQGENVIEAQGVQEAVAHNASGIILQGVEPDVVSAPLAQAFAKHIPVIDSFNGNPTQALDGLYAHVTVNFTQYGQEMGDYALAQTGCKSNVLIFSSTELPTLQIMDAGMTSEIAKLCSSCSTTIENVPPATIATTTGPLLKTAIARDPSADVIISAYDAIAIYLIPALQSENKTIPIISQNGDTQNLQYVANGTQAADLAFPPNAYIGWAEMDEMARAVNKAPSVIEDIPAQLFVKSNLNIGNPFPSFNYEAGFKSLWQVP
jgi:ribose transport system substrate-binding protein